MLFFKAKVDNILRYIYLDKIGNIKNEGVEQYSFSEATIYIHGLIYVYGKKAGKESIEWLYEEYSNNKEIPFNKLRGSFSCIFRTIDKIIIFTDNSNLHCVYYSKDFISSSFLKIVQLEKEHGRKIQFNDQALCEYFTLGNIFFNKTFFKEITILDSKHLLRVESGQIFLENKNIPDIEGTSDINSISDFFEKMSFSMSDMQVCQALTGGYDSRMVYACTSNHIPDHVAISANNKKHSDVIHANKVAKVNNDVLEIISTSKPVFSASLLNDIIVKTDGIHSIDIDSDIRLLHFNDILSENYNILLTGDGGVLHKDWEWTQDLPNYKRKNSNAKRFYYQRLYYINNGKHLGDALTNYFKIQEQLFVDQLNSLAKYYNTQSYDSWYYYISGNRCVNYNYDYINNLIRYAPLLELDIVSYSYALPRMERFFYNSIRKTISEENINIARILTNYGTTASNEIYFMIRDSFFQLFEYSRKAIRLVSRKLFKKTLLNSSVLDWSLERDIRNSRITKQAIMFAKHAQYIDNKILIDTLSYSEIQRLLHVFWLYNYTNGKTI